MLTRTKAGNATRYFINQDICKACGACVKACSRDAIAGESEKYYAIIDSLCRKCGECEGACKHDAITFSTTVARTMPPEERLTDYKKDFYQRLRNNISTWTNSKKGKVHRWTKYLMVAPDLFHLLCRAMLDKYVPIYQKLKLSFVIAYFVSPADLFSEIVMGPVAYIDDVALAAYAIHNLINNVDSQIVTRHWAGDGDLLKTTRHIMADAELMITTGIWKKLKKLF